jgi:hypothetical protein
MSNLRVAEKEKRKGGGGWGYYCNLVSIVNEKCYFFFLRPTPCILLIN